MGVRYRPDRERLERLREEVARLLPLLIDDDTVKVVLFGSTAQGRAGMRSDLDLLIVRRDSRPPTCRVDELYRRIQPRVALDLLVLTPQETAEGAESSSFIRHILRTGEVLYDRGRTVARAGAA